MEVKSLRTLNTIHLKLPPFRPRPQAKLYFVQPFTLYQHRFEGGGEGYSKHLNYYKSGYYAIFAYLIC